jgi:hypothetical protein
VWSLLLAAASWSLVFGVPGSDYPIAPDAWNSAWNPPASGVALHTLPGDATGAATEEPRPHLMRSPRAGVMRDAVEQSISHLHG